MKNRACSFSQAVLSLITVTHLYYSMYVSESEFYGVRSRFVGLDSRFMIFSQHMSYTI